MFGSKDTDPDPCQNVTDPDLQCWESGLVSFWKPDPDTYQSEKAGFGSASKSKAVSGSTGSASKYKEDPDPDPHDRDADPQAALEP